MEIARNAIGFAGDFIVERAYPAEPNTLEKSGFVRDSEHVIASSQSTLYTPPTDNNQAVMRQNDSLGTFWITY